MELEVSKIAKIIGLRDKIEEATNEISRLKNERHQKVELLVKEIHQEYQLKLDKYTSFLDEEINCKHEILIPFYTDSINLENSYVYCPFCGQCMSIINCLLEGNESYGISSILDIPGKEHLLDVRASDEKGFHEYQINLLERDSLRTFAPIIMQQIKEICASNKIIEIEEMKEVIKTIISQSMRKGK